jgi:phage-related protein
VLVFVVKLVAGLISWLSSTHLIIPVLIILMAVLFPIPTAIAAIGIAIGFLVTHWKTVWHDILSVVQVVWGWLKANWPLLAAILGGPVGIAVLLIKGHWATITKDAKAAWNAIKSFFTGWWSAETAEFKADLAVLTGAISAAWNAIKTVTSAVWNAVKGFFAAWWAVEVAFFRLVIATVEAIFTGGWGKVNADAKVAWNALLTFVKSLLTLFLGAISGALVTAVAYFAGLGARLVTAVGNLLGLLVQDGKDIVTGLLNGAKAILSDVANFFTSIPKKILGWLGIHSPPDWAVQAGKFIMQGIGIGMSQAKGAVSGVAQQVSGLVGSGVQRWAGLVSQALSMLGLPSSLLSRVLVQMQSESGGNPNAINLTDSNAAAGDPSRGLLQTIMSTFQAYHVAGTSNNIYDPLANIAAAINYARARYGPTLMSGGMGMGSGHGYAKGTSSAAPGWAWVGEGGVPELVKFKGGEQVGPVARSRGAMGGSTAVIEALLARLIDTTAAVPAGVGRHVGGQLTGVAADASVRVRYPHAGW